MYLTLHRFWILLLIGVLAASLGCRTGVIYTAADLPLQFQAPPIFDPESLDFSRMAGPPVNNEVIENGDVIEISIVAGLSADAVTKLTVRVGENGTALLPEIGPVPLRGLPLPAAEQVIAAACIQGRIFLQPQITVTMRQHARTGSRWLAPSSSRACTNCHARRVISWMP